MVNLVSPEHITTVLAAAEGASSAAWTLGRIFGMMAGIFFAGLVALFVILDIWGKYAVKGRAQAMFIQERSIFGMLLKIDGDKVHVGAGENKEDYLLQPDRMFLTLWPAFLPRPLQQPVRTWMYTKGSPEPIDPSNTAITITSKSLRIMSDEALLKSTWKDMREAVGMIQKRSPVTFILLLLLANSALSAFTLLMVMNLVKKFPGG